MKMLIKRSRFYPRTIGEIWYLSPDSSFPGSWRLRYWSYKAWLYLLVDGSLR